MVNNKERSLTLDTPNQATFGVGVQVIKPMTLELSLFDEYYFKPDGDIDSTMTGLTWGKQTLVKSSYITKIKAFYRTNVSTLRSYDLNCNSVPAN